MKEIRLLGVLERAWQFGGRFGALGGVQVALSTVGAETEEKRRY